MILLLGAVGTASQYVLTVEESNLPYTLEEIMVAGKRPVIYSQVELPIRGQTVFFSARGVKDGNPVEIHQTYRLDSEVEVTSIESYLSLLDTLRSMLFEKKGITLRFLFSIKLS